MNALEVVVCPKCGYGFHVEGNPDAFLCPRRECSFSWTAAGMTERESYSPEGREVEYSLRVVAGDAPSVFSLPKEGVSIIGRDPTCGIRLGNLQVSREHASIEIQDGVVRVKDLDSLSGTRIEGLAIGKGERTLRIGQHLIVAGVVLQLQARFQPGAAAQSHVDSRRLLRDSLAVPVRVHGSVADRFGRQGNWTIGRQDDRDVVLDHPLVSPKHAKIMREDGKTVVLDTRSHSGTFVNGRPVFREEIHKGDRLQIGPFLFSFDGNEFIRQESLTQLGIVALGLTQMAKGEKILDEVSFAIQPGEFVGVLGPSGAGKSTLLNALNGLYPAAQGNVLINGSDLYETYRLWRRHIGFVPQDDVVHAELTVEQAITYAARLRMPHGTGAEELRDAVEDAIRTVHLDHRRKALIARLSGGERKRVSVAVELVANPSLLFLDEPTAALDPGTAGGLMKTFRAMADQGRTVICTTHIMENLDLLDRIVVLVGGKLAYCGTPAGGLKHFGVKRFVDLYEVLESKSASEWQRAYKGSPDYMECVQQPTASFTGIMQNPASRVPRAAALSGPLGQFRTLTSRYFKVMLSDKWNLTWLAGQALAIGLLLVSTCPGYAWTAFFTLVSSMWLGCNLAVREIIRDRAIYARERMVGQNALAFYLSKFVVLLTLTLGQAGVLVSLLFLISGHTGGLLLQIAIFVLSAVTGVSMGLLVSSVIRSQITAVTLVPLLILPQMVLAGRLIPTVDFGKAAPLTWVCPSRSLNDALSCSLVEGKTVRTFAELFPGPKLGDLSMRGLGIDSDWTIRRAVEKAGGERAVRWLTCKVSELKLDDLDTGGVNFHQFLLDKAPLIDAIREMEKVEGAKLADLEINGERLGSKRLVDMPLVGLSGLREVLQRRFCDFQFRERMLGDASLRELLFEDSQLLYRLQTLLGSLQLWELRKGALTIEGHRPSAIVQDALNLMNTPLRDLMVRGMHVGDLMIADIRWGDGCLGDLSLAGKKLLDWRARDLCLWEIAIRGYPERERLLTAKLEDLILGGKRLGDLRVGELTVKGTRFVEAMARTQGRIQLFDVEFNGRRLGDIRLGESPISGLVLSGQRKLGELVVGEELLNMSGQPGNVGALLDTKLIDWPDGGGGKIGDLRFRDIPVSVGQTQLGEQEFHGLKLMDIGLGDLPGEMLKKDGGDAWQAAKDYFNSLLSQLNDTGEWAAVFPDYGLGMMRPEAALKLISAHGGEKPSVFHIGIRCLGIVLALDALMAIASVLILTRRQT